MIYKIKKDFIKALAHLHFNKIKPDSNNDLLDIAVLIALHCQELNIIRRICCPGEKGDRPLTKDDLKEMHEKEEYDWHHIED